MNWSKVRTAKQSSRCRQKRTEQRLKSHNYLIVVAAAVAANNQISVVNTDDWRKELLSWFVVPQIIANSAPPRLLHSNELLALTSNYRTNIGPILTFTSFQNLPDLVQTARPD